MSSLIDIPENLDILGILDILYDIDILGILDGLGNLGVCYSIPRLCLIAGTRASAAAVAAL